MLKSGIFSNNGEMYTVYEVDTKGFYRIDFIRGQAAFNVETENVAYSQIKRKTVYTYGDSAIYNEYTRVRDTIDSAWLKTKKTSNWEDGAYVVTQHSENAKLGFIKESKTKNGVLEECVRIGLGCTIQEIVIDALYDIKLLPINFSSYSSVTLSKDNVNTNPSGLFYSIEYLKRKYDLSHIDAKDVVVADTLDVARKRLYQFDKNKFPFKGFDTETTGTDVCMYGDDRLVGIILGADTETATYFPFRHEDDINLPIEFLDEIMEVVKRHEDHLVAHNKKFDRETMLKEGYDLHAKWDSMQISIILNPVLGKGIHGEKYLIEELTHNHYLELDEIFINSKDINFAKLPKEIIEYYACPDGFNPIILLVEFFKKLPKFQYRLAELECDLADVKADQEYYGIRVDVKKFEQQYRNCNYVLDMLLKAFRTLTQEDGNINSPQVLSNLIYNKMHCKVLLRTKTGQPSVATAAVKKLAGVRANEKKNITEDLVDLNGKVVIKAEDLAASAYPALLILAKYKEYNKLKTAFYSRFERTMRTGRIFFWINQNGAATGRQSSPMHQLPSELKDIVLSDADDRDFWGPDFSQVELRMIAYLAGEKDLIELAKDPDNDIHRIIGSRISNKEMWAITPKERSEGKRRNFGVVYLISAMGLAAQLFGPGYTKENVKYCQQLLDDFYHRFKRIDRYIKNNGKLVQTRGYMETKWFHRRRLFTEIFDPDLEPSKKASILRMANNVPVQGTAADYLKVAEVQMDKYIRLKGWNKIVDGFPMVRLMLSIHDEIILSAHNSIPYEEIIEMITLCMETPVDDAPPFFVQPALMSNWGEHSNDAVPMPIRYRDKVIKDYNETGASVFKRSYYNVIVPEDVNREILSNGKTVVENVKEYYDRVRLVFDHGDLGTEASEAHVMEAFKRYIESGFTTYCVNNYLDKLNEFRETRLHDYMTGLISQYGTDYREVGSHVRHPSLTHELLSFYDKQLDRDMDHVDRITEAARLYIDDLLNNKFGTKSTEERFTFTINTKESKESFVTQLEPLVNIDSNGEVVFDDASDDFEDVYNYFMDDDPDDIIERCENKPIYVWELGDTITFDVQELSKESIDKVLSYIYKIRQDNGFYKATLIYDGKLIDTHMCIENIDMDEANNIVASLSEKEVRVSV